jgi:hypothetical protein
VAQNSTDAVVARLEADWPNWQIWTVPKAIGGTIWCARRWDGTGQVLNAASADELAEYLERGVQPISPRRARVYHGPHWAA